MNLGKDVWVGCIAPYLHLKDIQRLASTDLWFYTLFASDQRLAHARQIYERIEYPWINRLPARHIAIYCINNPIAYAWKPAIKWPRIIEWLIDEYAQLKRRTFNDALKIFDFLIPLPAWLVAHAVTRIMTPVKIASTSTTDQEIVKNEFLDVFTLMIGKCTHSKIRQIIELANIPWEYVFELAWPIDASAPVCLSVVRIIPDEIRACLYQERKDADQLEFEQRLRNLKRRRIKKN
jgi:hypothetical protein